MARALERLPRTLFSHTSNSEQTIAERDVGAWLDRYTGSVIRYSGVTGCRTVPCGCFTGLFLRAGLLRVGPGPYLRPVNYSADAGLPVRCGVMLTETVPRLPQTESRVALKRAS